MPEDDGPGYSDLSAPKRQPRNGKSAHIVEGSPESGCNVRTQDPENFDEEVKSLVTAWRTQRIDTIDRKVTHQTLQESYLCGRCVWWMI